MGFSLLASFPSAPFSLLHITFPLLYIAPPSVRNVSSTVCRDIATTVIDMHMLKQWGISVYPLSLDSTRASCSKCNLFVNPVDFLCKLCTSLYKLLFALSKTPLSQLLCGYLQYMCWYCYYLLLIGSLWCCCCCEFSSSCCLRQFTVLVILQALF